MNKLSLFGALLAASIVGVTISFYVLLFNYQTQSVGTYMSDMMRSMMGQTLPMMGSGSADVPVYLWILPPVFITMLILGVVGIIYYLMVPQIRLATMNTSIGEASIPTVVQHEKVSAILKTLKRDEVQVFNVLVSHQGNYLQKHISKEAGLSRLKTHRIIARFVERGIVEVRPFGNTNEVSLSEWLKSEGDSKK